jgi:hypothetical protein
MNDEFMPCCPNMHALYNMHLLCCTCSSISSPCYLPTSKVLTYRLQSDGVVHTAAMLLCCRAVCHFCSVCSPSDAAVKAFLAEMGLSLADVKARPGLAKRIVASHLLLGSNVRAQVRARPAFGADSAYTVTRCRVSAVLPTSRC